MYNAITFGQLKEILEHLHPDQLACTVTVETQETEAFPCTFNVMDVDNSLGLENNHPVLTIVDGGGNRTTESELKNFMGIYQNIKCFGPVG